MLVIFSFYQSFLIILALKQNHECFLGGGHLISIFFLKEVLLELRLNLYQLDVLDESQLASVFQLYLIKFSDKIFAIFKKEAAFYKKSGGNVFWVGHPMIDLTKKLPLKKVARTILNLRQDQSIILLMPASRPQELRYILPTFMKSAKKLQQKYPSLVVYIPSCRDAFDEIFKKAFRKYQVKGIVISQKDSAKLKPYIYSLTKIALCKSGTVNMELALYGIPQIVGYRVSRVTAFIAKKILNFKVKFISPVNLLVNKLIIPEFVQKEFDEKKIFYKSCRILDGKSEKIKIKKGYSFLKKELGEEGVVQRAAKEIINSII